MAVGCGLTVLLLIFFVVYSVSFSNTLSEAGQHFATKISLCFLLKVCCA